MWKRNNTAEPQMGYHAHPEPTMDERYLETIPEVESLYSRRNSVAATALPELPFRAIPSMNERDSHDPASHLVANFVSQNPAAQTTTQPRPDSTGTGNVSPISTQDSYHPNGSDASLVSPIESTFPSSTQAPRPEPALRSQIPRKLPPVMKATSPEGDIPKRWSLREKKNEETRWDEYSGEPNQTGKPSSVRPGAVPSLEPQYPQLKERTRQILSGLKEREVVKKSTWGKAPPPVGPDPLDNPVQRPPWKGASGRQAIVEPVKNTPSARPRPLMLVERQRKAEQQAQSQTSGPVRSPEVAPRSPIDAVSVAASQLPTVRAVPSEESIKPVAPLKGRNTPRILSPTQVEQPRSLDSPFQSPGPAPPREAVPSPAPSTIRTYGDDSPTLGSSAPSLAAPEGSSSEESLDQTLKQKPLHREPDTSSSWNTYATNTVEDNSTAPPSPIARAELTSSPIPMAAPSTDIPARSMLRKRVTANNSGHTSYDYHSGISPFSNVSARKSSSNILRKAVGSNEKARAVSLMSNMSIAKSLPPTPVELQAADKVTSLEARLEDLSRRKRNLNKIIRELQESLKKNAIVYDARKRKEVDKMIINLNLELQEITNEEHETGLRLHRVQKRRDKDDFYEQPTGLWIKRVTS
ncbi:uncharacterized protein Z518_06643 [Rhinocladiella mackenziei CBS 650.93]|uniref:Uncharacterized protein n=1 Tax=Rhinocladiella mackenziei CBS 650.93 TaxID=1442369 RepID=A0A0D2GY15_9EURO|nr:uncharacterized protein Z518_06643 [Rhinocladiella mackenziei CBS 650.93]KIX03093.1 hypothetical protein Z518_06643 [Rhinocladiella mackenziei CBS 650.93]